MMDKILFGCAYYDEYMPEERLEKDMAMMNKAGINVIRIAESTWATEEPEEGKFDFSHVQRTIEAAAGYGISVIVGTPTYAIPPWLAFRYPDIIAVTENGQGKYGTRQNMDITNAHYLYYAERIIRKLMECVSGYGNVTGFQLDNETKHYHVAGAGVQKKFAGYLKEKFHTIDELNREFGFSYWSNSVDCWEHLPDVTGSINASYVAEFEKFRRTLVDEFLLWQRKIIDEYRREDQFVTHNFDFEWRECSFGIQPDTDHFHASKAVTIAGCDIYHKSQDKLTGKEAAFCGSITRGLKKEPYLVLETGAQGHVDWTPYDGQLRMQTFSHLANGADSVMYWHWHSIHNSFETYWRGILSHDLEENRIYREIASIGRDLQKIGDHLTDLKKENSVAILVSNESLTALSGRPMFPLPGDGVYYNDVVRRYADALYELNIEYDIISPDTRDFSAYRIVIVPVLYSAPDELLTALKEYEKAGGMLIVTFKSGYANEYLTVSHDKKPHILHECLGVSYQEYTVPVNVSVEESGRLKDKETELTEKELTDEDRKAETWMEFLTEEGADRLAGYVHPYWNRYAAVTEYHYGKGTGIYIGCHLSLNYLKLILQYCADKEGVCSCGLEGNGNGTANPDEPENKGSSPVCFPINIKNGTNRYGKKIHYYFNYSGDRRMQKYLHAEGTELLSSKKYKKGDIIEMTPWSVLIFEEQDT